MFAGLPGFFFICGDYYASTFPLIKCISSIVVLGLSLPVMTEESYIPILAYCKQFLSLKYIF